ncbi:MAG: methyltransferase domain-containing protein [Ardenticatenia bacterium]|nr:methyltransferase domain-containing protein [Ardenticatenia bacterium]
MAAAPFDAIAPHYDHVFTSTRLGRWLREAVWTHVATAFRPGDYVLDLGCGTGEDAVWLAKRGVRVIATDVSPAMLQVARAKAEAEGVRELVDVILFDVEQHPPSLFLPPSSLDGALSNFGVLNCLADRRPVVNFLANVVQPGGRIVLVVMGPFCPWELLWHLAHGQVRTAFRRWRPGRLARIGPAQVRVWYPSPRRLRQEFTPYFRPLYSAGIGVLLPPSYLGHLVDRHPRLFRALTRIDRRLSRYFPWTWLNDHYVIVFERTDVHCAGAACYVDFTFSS